MRSPELFAFDVYPVSSDSQRAKRDRLTERTTCTCRIIFDRKRIDNVRLIFKQFIFLGAGRAKQIFFPITSRLQTLFLQRTRPAFPAVFIYV
jgi:hypothetical protein